MPVTDERADSSPRPISTPVGQVRAPPDTSARVVPRRPGVYKMDNDGVQKVPALPFSPAMPERSPRPALNLSVVVPVLNAASTLPGTLAALVGVAEVVVVDGGSEDASVEIAASAGARLVTAPRGRGSQLAAGAAAAACDWLLLLHADTRLQSGWRSAVAAFMAEYPSRAGYFRFALDSADPRARRLERLVAWRSRVLGLPYGDQGLLLRRDLLAAIGGIKPIPLMEDVDLVRRLGRHRLTELDAVALTAAGRWEREGWYRRSARNLLCLSLYLAGIPPRAIARLYG
jgi:rSAM/selenodomain-associated transferase 2